MVQMMVAMMGVMMVVMMVVMMDLNLVELKVALMAEEVIYTIVIKKKIRLV